MRNGFLGSIILGGLLISGLSGALEMEYISPDKKSELAREFENADFSSNQAASIKQKKWTCDMYGVRTRLQVKRGVKLYQWASDWHNEGAQIVRDYKNENGNLIGQHGPLEDQVRVNSKGQLISRLSLTRPEREVVAYAVCDTP